MFYEVDRDPYLPKHSHSSFMSSPESSPAESSSLESLDASPPMFSFGQGVERTRDEPEWKSGGVARRTHTTPAKKDTRLIPSSQRRKSTEDDKIERYRETKAQQYEAYKKNVELKKQMKAIDEEHEYRMRTGRSLAPTTSEKKKKKPSYLYRKVEQYIGNPNEVADLMLFLGLGGFAWGVVHPKSFKKFTQNFLPGFLQRTISNFSPQAAKALEESFKKDEHTSKTMTDEDCSNKIAEITNGIHTNLQKLSSNRNTPRESIIDYLKNISTSGELLKIKSLLRQCTHVKDEDDYKKLTEIKDLVEYTYGPIKFETSNYTDLFDKLKLTLENQSDLQQLSGATTTNLGAININDISNISTNIASIALISYAEILNNIQYEVKSQNPSENEYLKILLLCCCALQKTDERNRAYLDSIVLSCLVQIIQSTISDENTKLTYLVCCSNFLPSLNIIIERYLNIKIDEHVSSENQKLITSGIEPRTCKATATKAVQCTQEQITNIINVFVDTEKISQLQNIMTFVDKASAFICNGKGSIYHLMLKALLSSPTDFNMHVHKAMFLQKLQKRTT